MFASKIKRRCVDFREYRLNYEHLQMIQIEHFLRDFGSSVESLEISECYIQEAEGKSNTLLKIIRVYCKNFTQLNTFTLTRCQSSDEYSMSNVNFPNLIKFPTN